MLGEGKGGGPETAMKPGFESCPLGTRKDEPWTLERVETLRNASPHPLLLLRAGSLELSNMLK
jgi:hypothetical protein